MIGSEIVGLKNTLKSRINEKFGKLNMDIENDPYLHLGGRVDFHTVQLFLNELKNELLDIIGG